MGRRSGGKVSGGLKVESMEPRLMMTASVQTAESFSFAVGSVRANDVAHDSAGNTYLAGSIEVQDTSQGAQSFDLDPSTVYADNRDLLTVAETTGFVAKYDESGSLLWVNSGANLRIDRLALGASGDVYVSGTFWSAVQLGTKSLPAPAFNADRFASRMTNSGSVQWLAGYSLATNEFETRGIAADEAHGRVYLAAQQMVASPGQREAVVVSIDAATGQKVWNQSLVAAAVQRPEAGANSVDVDSTGAIVVGGYISGSADFDPGSGKLNLSSGSGGRFDNPVGGFIWKLSPAGSLVWAKVLQGTKSADANVRMVKIREANSVMVSGNFSGTVDLDPGKGTRSFTANGTDAFLLKLNADSSFNFATALILPDYQSAAKMAFDSGGNIYVAGPSTAGSFVAKFTSTGNFIEEFDLIQSVSTLVAIAVNPATDKLSVAGYFTGNLDLNGDGTPDLVAMGEASYSDMFWATYTY